MRCEKNRKYTQSSARRPSTMVARPWRKQLSRYRIYMWYHAIRASTQKPATPSNRKACYPLRQLIRCHLRPYIWVKQKFQAFTIKKCHLWRFISNIVPPLVPLTKAGTLVQARLLCDKKKQWPGLKSQR